MDDERRRLPVRMDAYTRICLGAITVLLAVLIVGLWAERDPLTGTADAKGPFLDTSTQVQVVQLLRAQEKTAVKIDELTRLFRSGQAKVQLAREPGEKAKGADRAPQTPKR